MSLRATATLFVLLEVLVAAAYSNVVHGEFQFDDESSIVQNPVIRDIATWARHAADNPIATSRPLVVLSFGVNYAVGGLEVWGYHLVNVAVHMAVVLLVFLLTLRVLEDSREVRARPLALFVAAAWGVHPLQSQAVSYVAQRAEALSSLFYLMALLLLTAAPRAPRRRVAAGLYLGGTAAFVVGLGTKEIIITLPAAFLLYELYFHRGMSLARRVVWAAPLWLLGGAYAYARMRALAGNKDIGAGVRAFGPYEYLLSQFRVVIRYLELVFWPAGQTVDYDFPLSKTVWDARTLGAALVLLALLAAAGRLRRREPAASFGILWFFLVLAPTSSVIPIIDVIFEHRAYLASWGIVLATAVLTHALVSSVTAVAPPVREHAAAAAALLVVVALSLTLYRRNEVWRTKLSLWSDAASKAPNKPRVHNNLGNCHALRNDLDAAEREFRRALELAPHWPESQYNLALTLERLGRYEEARRYFLLFAEQAPDVPYRDLKQQIGARFGTKP